MVIVCSIRCLLRVCGQDCPLLLRILVINCCTHCYQHCCTCCTLTAHTVTVTAVLAAHQLHTLLLALLYQLHINCTHSAAQSRKWFTLVLSALHTILCAKLHFTLYSLQGTLYTVERSLILFLHTMHNMHSFSLHTMHTIQILYPYQDETRDMRSNITLCLKEFPRAKPE